MEWGSCSLPFNCTQAAAILLLWNWALLSHLDLWGEPCSAFYKQILYSLRSVTRYSFSFFTLFLPHLKNGSSGWEEKLGPIPWEVEKFAGLFCARTAGFFIYMRVWCGGWNFCRVRTGNRCKDWSLACPAKPVTHSASSAAAFGMEINICLRNLIHSFVTGPFCGNQSGNYVKSKWNGKCLGAEECANMEGKLKQVEMVRNSGQSVFENAHILKSNGKKHYQ